MSLFSPKSIAVIGVSADERKVGHLILRNLVTQGYAGKIYPVNPKGGEILGKKVFPSVSAIDGPVDLAVIVTPAATVNRLAEECGKKGILSLAVISSGFREAGGDGKAMEEELRRTVERYSMKLIGPNSLGIIRPGICMNASFANRLPPAGSVALLSQSGALGDAFIDRAEGIGLKLSLFLSIGNKVSMDESDFLELCGEDLETKVIGLYLEGIVDGPRFLTLAKRIGREKRIILLKGGVTEKGRQAASSHTGALAGTDAAIEAICAQAGIVRARSTRQFLDLLRTLSQQPPLLSSRIAVITNAGGPGVLAADAAEREGLSLPALTPGIEQALRSFLPPAASVRNPIDVLGDALADRYEQALKAAVNDPNIDGAIVILTPQVMTPAKEIAEMLVRIKHQHALFPFVSCFMGGEGVREAIAILHADGVTNFSCPESAMHILALLRPPERMEEKQNIFQRDERRAAKAAQLFEDAGLGLLNEERTEKLLELYGLPFPRSKVAATADEAVKIAEEIGFPVTAKVSSKEILHKTEIGGVVMHLTTAEEVRKAFDTIMRNARERAPQARVAGVLIQQCLPPGNEFIVGALKDETAGHLVMAGLGGVYTELFRDTSFRVAPVSAKEAYAMLAQLKSWQLLLGMRGKPPLAIDAFAEFVSVVSLLANECPQIREIDFNPVLDAKIVLGV